MTEPARPRAARLLPRLGAHHWRVLDLLATEPLLSTGQVEALVFTAGTPLSRARTCRRILRELTSWGLLHRQRRPPGRFGGGSDPATFALTARGDRVLALRDGRRARALRPSDCGEGSRAHVLAVGDLRVALTHAARVQDARLIWRGEPGCWREVVTTAGREHLKPDAYLELTRADETRLAWIELDRGTQSLPVTVQAKARRYCRVARALAAAAEPVPEVLFVVAEPRRRGRLTERLPAWAANEGINEETAKRLFASLAPASVAEHLLRPSGQRTET